MLRALGLEHCELSVLLCDDRIMRRLNREYRAQDRPTDVLAFAMREGPTFFVSARDDMLGDVAISWPTAARQAAQRRTHQHVGARPHLPIRAAGRVVEPEHM